MRSREATVTKLQCERKKNAARRRAKLGDETTLGGPTRPWAAFWAFRGRGGPQPIPSAVLGQYAVMSAGSRQTQSRPIFYSLPRRRCYTRHGVDRPASRHAGPALPASTSA